MQRSGTRACLGADHAVVSEIVRAEKIGSPSSSSRPRPIIAEVETPRVVVARFPRPRKECPDVAPRRAVRVDALELEGRLLLSALPVPIAATTTQKPSIAQLIQSVGFVGTPTPGTSQVTQIVTQQAGTATVTLLETGKIGPLQVEVRTDPSSPAVGVNVGAVDQIVTFPEGQTEATLSVPILAGAPNPGEVDVTLTATPVNPPTPVTSSWPPGAPHRGVGCVDTANHHRRTRHPPGHRAHVQQADGPGRGFQRE